MLRANRESLSVNRYSKSSDQYSSHPLTNPSPTPALLAARGLKLAANSGTIFRIFIVNKFYL
jgi:hypothetical protein